MEFKSSIFVKYLRSLYKVNLKRTNIAHSILIEAIFKTFVQVEEDINAMALEVCVTTATGKWLDLWGDYFGILRKVGEEDNKYSERMISEVIEPKATITALKRATARWINQSYNENYEPSEIQAFEPWKELLVTSQRGAISYMGRLPDSDYWTHGVIDISIPDSSEMSAELIVYLNTIKACGVKIAWHTSMGWETLVGYFEQARVLSFIEKFYDIWIQRGYSVTDGMRTLSEWTDKDEAYNTPISVAGYLSGRQVNSFEVSIARDFEPFRFTTRVVQNSPIIRMDDIAYYSGVSYEDLTVQQATQLELSADRQIPNVHNTGLLFEEEIREFLDTPIKGIVKELEDASLYDLTQNQFKDKTIEQIQVMFDEDTVALNKFLNYWRKHNYINKPINTNPLSNCTGPLKILIETDV